MAAMTDKARLIDLLLERSFRYRPEAPFTLASGRTSPYYFNCKTTLYHPEGMRLVGRLLFAAVRELHPAAVGGLTLGADPLAYACAYTSHLEGQPIEAFVVRKEPKDHGTKLPIEGNVRPGDRVVVVDDVITTGGSTLKAIAACRAAGLEVVGCCVLVDRQEGGREAIAAAGVTVTALVTRDEVMAARRA
jgi:orotate phosphoribosyltransferase